ncbi:hypothetical protein [Mycolicibacterium aromaticivorans]|nr:hypothetical protein [Mycolicibacterium aromaticivorans]
MAEEAGPATSQYEFAPDIIGALARAIDSAAAEPNQTHHGLPRADGAR